jgi:hypothetical protein
MAVQHKRYMSENGCIFFVRQNEDRWEIVYQNTDGYIWPMGVKGKTYATYDEAQFQLDETMQNNFFANSYAMIPVKELRSVGRLMTDEERITIARQHYEKEEALGRCIDGRVPGGSVFTTYAQRGGLKSYAQFLYVEIGSKIVICYQTATKAEFFVDNYNDIDLAIKEWFIEYVHANDTMTLLEEWGFSKVGDKPGKNQVTHPTQETKLISTLILYPNIKLWWVDKEGNPVTFDQNAGVYDIENIEITTCASGIDLYGFTPDKVYFHNAAGTDEVIEAAVEYLWHDNPDRDGVPDGEREDQIDEVINNLPWTQCAIVTITPKTTDA